VKAFAAAWLAVLSGCELIADIPGSAASSGDDVATSDGGTDDGGTGDGMACTTPEDCLAPTAVCDVPTGTCVQCLLAATCAASEPVCGDDHACHACAADQECGSGVCLLDGTCAAPAAILYAAPTGIGAACTDVVPCTFSTAASRLNSTTNIIKLAAAVFELPDAIPINATNAFIAGTGATLHGVTGGGMFPQFTPLVSVTGGDATITGVVFDSNGKFGLTAPGGKVTIARATFQGGFLGMFVSAGGTAIIERTVFKANSFYGMYASDNATFSVRNSLFVNNGSTTNALAPLNVSMSTGTVENVTFANNLSDGTMGAINCIDGPVPKVTNIISFGHSTTVPAACSNVTYSDLEAGYAGASLGNVTLDPLFANAAAGDFHLQSASPVRGLGDPASTNGSDVDGQTRPQPAGTQRDLGADEVP